MLTLKSQPDISPGKQVYLGTTKDLQSGTCSQGEQHASLLKQRKDNFYSGEEEVERAVTKSLPCWGL